MNKFKANIITFQLNIPGPVKDKLLYKVSLIEGVTSLKKRIKACHYELLFEDVTCLKTGPEGVLLVKGDVDELKKIMIDFEESHPLGRIFDIDVYDQKGFPVSRCDLGNLQRSCYVCNDLAKVCARSKRHDIDVIITHIETLMMDYHSDTQMSKQCI